MKAYQQEFVEFLVEVGALSFGSFTLKSGRQSPYFFNSAKFDTAATLERLGFFYASRVAELKPVPTVIYGPAYKGIPLAVATSLALRIHFGTDTAYCFDRKEAKGHGDKGLLVGHLPTESDRVVIVDDVITDGRTKVEAIEKLRETSNAPLTGLVVALDRQETTADGEDPIERVERTGDLQVSAIATLDHVIAALAGREIGGRVLLDEETRRRIEKYRNEYGVRRRSG